MVAHTGSPSIWMAEESACLDCPELETSKDYTEWACLKIQDNWEKEAFSHNISKSFSLCLNTSNYII